MSTLAPIHTMKMTAEQYFLLGEDPPGTHLELIDGEIIVSPSPNRSHAEIIVELVYLLKGHIKRRNLGKLYLDTDVIFTSRTVRRPDIAYFGSAKLKQMPGKRLNLPPDLCVEVLSPSNAEDDRVNKFNLYESHGVAHYWIVDPEARTAECFSLQKGKYSLTVFGHDSEKVRFPPFTNLVIALSMLWVATS